MKTLRLVASSCSTSTLALMLLGIAAPSMAAPPTSPTPGPQNPSVVEAPPSCGSGKFCAFDGSSYTYGRKDFSGEIDNLSWSGWKFSSGKSMYKEIASGVNRSSGNNRTIFFRSPGRTGEVAFCVNPGGNAAYLKTGEGNAAVSVTWALGSNRSCYSG